MTLNVIAFPNVRPQPVVCRPLYELKWTTESQMPVTKVTTDRAGIERQLESCRKRGLPAVLRAGGRMCGGVMEITHGDGSRRYVATIEDESWG